MATAHQTTDIKQCNSSELKQNNPVTLELLEKWLGVKAQ